MKLSLYFLLIFFTFLNLWSNSSTVLWQDHYEAALPLGFDPWCGPVAGLSSETEVTVMTTVYDGDKLIDIYYPPDTVSGPATNSMLFISGNSDTTLKRETGRPWMRSNQALGWARLAAEQGLIAITYETGSHTRDSLKLIGLWLKENGSQYGINSNKTGIWACSDSCGLAVKTLYTGYKTFSGIKPLFGIFYYGDVIMSPSFDISIPVLLVKAEKDVWANGPVLDRFAEKLKENGGRITYLIHKSGDHGFDTRRADAETLEIINQTLTFMKTASHP